MKFTTRIKSPYKFIPFSLCQVCGQTYRADEIQYNPRWGWQCPPCWDGMISRDQIMRPIFPYEGTRKTMSPVVPAGQGLSEVQDTNPYVYTLFDRDGTMSTADTYDVTFGEYITFYKPSTRVGVDGVSPDGGIDLNNGWVLYIKGEYMMFSRVYRNDVFSRAPWQGNGDMFVDADGFLNYTPYVPATIQGLDN